jgi:hypothetical protein
LVLQLGELMLSREPWTVSTVKSRSQLGITTKEAVTRKPVRMLLFLQLLLGLTLLICKRLIRRLLLNSSQDMLRGEEYSGRNL